MKAVVIESFGGVEVLKLSEVPVPQPTDSQILVEIKYAAINPVDWKIRQGYLKDIFPHIFPVILGWDAAGVVAKVGKNVRNFKVGDKVYSYTRKPEVHGGTYAQFVTLDEASVAHMPTTIDFAQASSLPLTGLTAYQALHDIASIRAGENVLILGGSGGVGGLAIQIAKAAGANVIATTSTGNKDYVKSLGADFVVDYLKENVPTTIANLNLNIDVVLDTVGGETQKNAFDLVRDGGRFVSIVDTPDVSKLQPRSVQSGFHFVTPSGRQLEKIASLVDDGKLDVLPLTKFNLEDIADAHRLSQSARTRGKIVVAI